MLDPCVNGHAKLRMLRTCTFWHFIIFLVILLFFAEEKLLGFLRQCVQKRYWLDKICKAFTIKMVKLLKSNFSTSNLKFYATSKVLYLKKFNIQVQWNLIKIHYNNFFYLQKMICIASLLPTSHSYFFYDFY